MKKVPFIQIPAFREGKATALPDLPGSARAALAWSLMDRDPRPQIWVMESTPVLEQFYRDLCTLRPDEAEPRALLYPAREGLPGRDVEANTDIMTDRLDVLRSVQKGVAPFILAVSVQGLMQPVPTPESLEQRQAALAVGDHHDFERFIETLDELGYRFEAEVVEKGQASVRGGIVDCWPLSEPYPVRLEFFGPELDSIRRFDPATQVSVERLQEILLTPLEDRAAYASSEWTDLSRFIPGEALWVWSEPASCSGHAEAYFRQITETSGEGSLQSYERLKRSVRKRFAMPPLYIGSGEPTSARSIELPVHAEAGLAAPLAGAQDMDILESTRLRYLSELLRRAREGEHITLYFSSEGGLERFRETYRQQNDDLDLLSFRTGVLSEGFTVPQQQFAVLSETDFYGKRKTLRGRYDPHARRKETGGDTRVQDWTEIQPGDFVVHIDHGIGRFIGIQTLDFNGQDQEVISLEYAGDTLLHLPVSQSHLLSRYVGVGKAHPNLHQLGGSRWLKEKASAQRAVQDLAASLLETQAARETLRGHAFAADTHWQQEFEASFPFQETADQDRAIREVKENMEQPKPMDRLLCGDVGYGKTEVAMRAAFKAVMDGRQVAMLVPTTILAQQHFMTFRERMSAFPVRIEQMSRFRTAKEQKSVVTDLKKGTIDILIGTHRIVQDDVQFKNLGLVIIDEEQRFGVTHKEHLKGMRTTVDVLTMSATPIPRTLYMSLTGARDMSTIQTPPRERQPIQTLVTPYQEQTVRHAILRELNREGQVFFLHNRVKTIHSMHERLQKLVPEARIEIGHGQMNERELEQVMRRFSNGDFDVLLCTTIIESGVDIPNANTILIDRADRFGLSDLYQLRGRVGRYRHKAYAYLLMPPRHLSGQTARKRIRALQKYSALGAGFKIALQDLEIRGSGNLLGSEQSGHISAVGFDLYCQFLKRTVAHLKNETVPDLVDVDIKLDFLRYSPEEKEGDNIAAIPFDYTEDEVQRLTMYRRLSGLMRERDLKPLAEELDDRYGKRPVAVENLLQLARLRIVAANQNISHLEVRDDRLMMKRKRVFLKKNAKFPRLTHSDPGKRLAEIVRIIRAWRDD